MAIFNSFLYVFQRVMEKLWEIWRIQHGRTLTKQEFRNLVYVKYNQEYVFNEH